MIVAGEFSFNGGKEFIQNHFAELLSQTYEVVQCVDSEKCKDKISQEKTMQGKLLYSPAMLNQEFKKYFSARNWHNHKEKCNYPTQYYTKNYQPKPLKQGAFRDMDFVKERLGVEVQFGKYAFMVYNVCAKMTIFKKLNIIDAGIEIVPIKELADEMSSGVSYFEQFVWDLEKRGVSDIDIPVLILGVL